MKENLEKLVVENIDFHKKSYENLKMFPWPILILIILGMTYILCGSFLPGIPNDRRIFGGIFIFLWTILWSVFLWIFWRDDCFKQAWWLLICPVVLTTLFFLLVVALRY